MEQSYSDLADTIESASLRSTNLKKEFWKVWLRSKGLSENLSPPEDMGEFIAHYLVEFGEQRESITADQVFYENVEYHPYRGELPVKNIDYCTCCGKDCKGSVSYPVEDLDTKLCINCCPIWDFKHPTWIGALIVWMNR